MVKGNQSQAKTLTMSAADRKGTEILPKYTKIILYINKAMNFKVFMVEGHIYSK